MTSLLGTWTLTSAVCEEIPSGAQTDMFGPDPHGFINYSPEGRMIALITCRDRKARATPAEAEALYRGMLSYAGTFTVEGDVVTHHIDISWSQSFTGGAQKRNFRLVGNRLILSTPQSHDPIDGRPSVRRMTWQKV